MSLVRWPPWHLHSGVQEAKTPTYMGKECQLDDALIVPSRKHKKGRNGFGAWYSYEENHRSLRVPDLDGSFQRRWARD